MPNDLTYAQPVQPMTAVPIEGGPGTPNPVEVSLPGKPGKQPKPISKSIQDADKRLKGEARADAKAKAGTDPDLDGDDGDTQRQRQHAKEGARRKATSDAITNADAKLKGKASQPATDSTAYSREAPARFSADAKADWSQVPEHVRHEVHRMHRELEAGIRQYSAAAHAYSDIADYDQHCRKHGTTVRRALDQYTGLDRALRSPNVEHRLPAIEAVLAHAGLNPERYSRLILSMTPEDKMRLQANTQASAMEGRMRQLEGALTQQAQQTQTQVVLAQVENAVLAFSQDKADFNDLADEMVVLINTGHGLESAYATARDNARRRTAAGKSIHGAPSSGTAPPARKGGRVSIDEALKRAHSRLAG